MARVTKSDLDWFLGRYDVTDRRNNKHPFREFTGINRNANELKLEMDFLELDSWDSDARYGPDCIYVHIDGVRLFLGIYANWRDEGYRSGNHGGIRWTSSSRGAPSHLGFSSRWKDQRHRLTFIIPRHYFADGKINLKLEAVLDSTKDDESAGWDNIRLYELYQCGRRLNSDDVDVDKDLFLEALAQSKGDDFIQVEEMASTGEAGAEAHRERPIVIEQGSKTSDKVIDDEEDQVSIDAEEEQVEDLSGTEIEDNDDDEFEIASRTPLVNSNSTRLSRMTLPFTWKTWLHWLRLRKIRLLKKLLLRARRRLMPTRNVATPPRHWMV